MYELIQSGERSWYIQCPAKIGIYLVNDTDVYLIDSGNDKDAGKRVNKILGQNGWNLKGILNTHSNADHIGGNSYLQNQTGCKVFAEGIEAAFTEYPILEPSFLYGGFPFRELRHKFLLASPSRTDSFSDPDFPQDVEAIPLPGHFFQMFGFRLPDGVVFLADCLSSPATLEKYPISFIYDVEEYLKTLEMVSNMNGAFFVPSHADATENIRPLAEYNRQKVLELAERIYMLCKNPISFEELLRELFNGFGLTLNFEQYVLSGSTVRSYLAWMKDQGRIDAEFAENRLLWRAV